MRYFAITLATGSKEVIMAQDAGSVNFWYLQDKGWSPAAPAIVHTSRGFRTYDGANACAMTARTLPCKGNVTL